MPNHLSSDFARHRHVQWLVAVLALAALAALVSALLAYDRERTEQRENELMMLQARVIDENLGWQFIGMTAALDSVRTDMAALQAKGLRTRRLKALTDAMPGVRTLLVTNADGVIIDSNWHDLIGRNVSERAYFRTAKSQPSLERLYVSEPFETLLKAYSLNVVKIWTDERGRFGGVISATLDPDYFQVLLQSVLYAPDMRSTMIHSGGLAFVSVPLGNPIAGINLRAPNSFFSRHMDSGQRASLLTGTTVFSGENRMAAYRTFQPEALHMDRPLVLSVSRTRDAVLAPWRMQAGLYALAYLAVALAVCTSMFLLQRKQKAMLHLTLLRERESREHVAKLQLALASANLGLWELDPATGRRTTNARAQEMLGLPPGAPAEDQATWLQRIHPDDRQTIERAVQARPLGPTGVFEIDYRARHENGQWIWIHSCGQQTHWHDDGTPQTVTGTYLDITQQKDAEAQITALAFLDPLTQLPNRRLLQDRLDQVQRGSARTHEHAAVLFLDLDRFKWVNDTLGHDMGDHLLQQVAQRLQACVRQSDTVARLGGDEFVLVVYPLGETAGQAQAHARAIANTVLAALRQPVVLGTVQHTITTSIGVALFCGREDPVDQVLKRADQAMYRAKAAGRNQAHIDAPPQQPRTETA